MSACAHDHCLVIDPDDTGSISKMTPVTIERLAERHAGRQETFCGEISKSGDFTTGDRTGVTDQLP